MEKNSSGGIGCLTVLGIIFIVLKLTGNITWSWWWVLSPFLFQFAVVGVVVLLIAAAASSRRR